MEPNQIQLGWVQLLAEHEEAIGNLYHLFSLKFPESKAFWSALSDDEFRHAMWIRTILNQFLGVGGRLRPDRFHPEAVQLSLDFINRQLQLAEQGPISLKTAVSIATQLENAIIERRFFEIFESSDPQMDETIQKIIVETERHRDSLKKFQLRLH